MSDKKTSIKIYVALIGVGLTFFAIGCYLYFQENNEKPTPLNTKKVSGKIEVQKSALTVEIKKPILKEIDNEIQINGDVLPWQESIISSEISGVRVEDIFVDVGDTVTKGQILTTLNSDIILADYNIAKASVSEAEANFKEAIQDANRARSLDKANVLSSQQMSQYLSAESKAKARLESAKAQLEMKKVMLEHTKIKSPDDGVVSSRTAAVGNLVNVGELFKIIRQEKLQWKPQVSIDKLRLIQKEQPVEIYNKSGETIYAKINQISPSINYETRRATILVDLPKELHQNKIQPGFFLNGVIKVGKKDSLLVNQQSIVLKDGTNYVFVYDEKTHIVNQVKVEIGKRDGDFVVIENGLDKDNNVVVSGAAFLNNGDKVNIAQ